MDRSTFVEVLVVLLTVPHVQINCKGKGHEWQNKD